MKRSDDALLFHEVEMQMPELARLAAGDVVVYTNRSPEKTTANEDSALILPLDEQGYLLAVADGVGGLPNGQLASGLALKTLSASVQKSLAKGVVSREAILQGIDQANDAVLKKSAGGATTLSVVEVVGSTVRPYQIGDSIILVVGQRGRIKYQATTHSPMGYAVESGLMAEEEALIHDERHLVSNVVGDLGMHVELGVPLQLDRFDTVLLASDGIADNFTVEEIAARIRKGPLGEAAAALVSDVYERMMTPCETCPSKADDYSFICYRPRRAV